MAQNTPPFVPGIGLTTNPDRRVQGLRADIDKANAALAVEVARTRPEIIRLRFGYRDVQNTAPGVYNKIKFYDVKPGTIILEAFAWTSELFKWEGAADPADEISEVLFSVGYREFKGTVVATEDRDGILVEKDCYPSHQTWSQAADKGILFGASYKNVNLISARERGELILAVKVLSATADLSLLIGGKLEVAIIIAEP